MCGHIGIMGKKLEAKHEDALEDGLFISALRGHDSVGVGIVPFKIEDAPFVQKRLGMAPYYLKIPNDGARVLIGHVRSATIGGAHDRDLAHPFMFDNIIGAHNGTLRGDWRGPLQDQTNERFGSDSQAVFYNFAYWGVKETVESIYGAWCFIWWDDDEQTLNMLRNDERPLWTARGKDGNLYWASEHWMINGMLRAGEKDRDKLVKTATADGKDERFFHKLPVNTWRRFTFDDDGNIVQLEDQTLLGKEEPKVERVPFVPANYSRNASDGGSEPFVYALWRDGKWVETSEPQDGALKLATSYARSQPSMRGLLYRTMAGELYVSKPGCAHSEVPFKQFIEFETDGSCSCCGTFIEHPIEIGYLADDFKWFACRECVKDWMGVEAGDNFDEGDLADIMTSTDADLAMEMGDSDPFTVPAGLDPDIDVFGQRPGNDNKMVTLGRPPADPDPDVVEIEDMVRAIEAQAGLGNPDADLAEAGEAVAAARAAMNPDGEKPKRRRRREKLSLKPISDTGRKGVPLDDIPWDDLNDELPVELRDSLPPSLLAKLDEADRERAL